MTPMIFPRINQRSCVAFTPTPLFFILRGVGPSNTILFSAFVDDGATITEVTDDITWASSDTAVATINSGGLIALVASGTVVISATRGDDVAYAPLTLSSDVDFCDDRPVATILVIDNSMSMTVTMGVEYQNALHAAKAVATLIASALDDEKDFIAVETFEGAPRVDLPFSQSIDAIVSKISKIKRVPHTVERTDINRALALAVSRLEHTSIEYNQGVIILISDGAIDPDPGSEDERELQQRAKKFKDGGGVIICIGMNTTGRVYSRLRDMATPGHFINVSGAAGSAAAAASQVVLYGLNYCAG